MGNKLSSNLVGLVLLALFGESSSAQSGTNDNRFTFREPHPASYLLLEAKSPALAGVSRP